MTDPVEEYVRRASDPAPIKRSSIAFSRGTSRLSLLIGGDGAAAGAADGGGGSIKGPIPGQLPGAEGRRRISLSAMEQRGGGEASQGDHGGRGNSEEMEPMVNDYMLISCHFPGENDGDSEWSRGKHCTSVQDRAATFPGVSDLLDVENKSILIVDMLKSGGKSLEPLIRRGSLELTPTD